MLDNGCTRASYALELDSGKTRGDQRPKPSLSIKTESDAESRAIAKDLRVVGEGQRRRRSR